jgi:Xaa-Pro aminopeptidase
MTRTASARFAKYGPIGEREVVFEAGEYKRRLAAVRQRLEAAELDLLVTFSPANITYLSCHSSANIRDYHCLIVSQTAEPVLVLWYFELGRFHASAVDTVAEAFGTGEDPVPFTVDVLQKYGEAGRRIGIDGGVAAVGPETLQRLIEALRGERVRLVSGLVESVRAVKSPPELDLLRQSARLTGAGVQAAVAAMRVGVRDFEIAAEAHRAMLAGGSQYLSSQPYVCPDWRAGTPHSNAGGSILAAGSVVFLEMGATVGRYTAPIMRTATLGPPRPDVARVAGLSQDALAAVMDAMRAGISAAKVAEAGDRVVAGRLTDDMIFHFTYGYPVGLGHPPTWAEEPGFLILRTNPEPLVAGMVFHLPMSFRVYGRFGVMFSETVHVTEAGIEVLTEMIPRRLFRIEA